MMHLVVYDVEDGGTRARVAGLLEGYGRRVQQSVFECHLDDQALRELTIRLQKELTNDPEGEVRLYRVCGRCLEGSYGIGDVEHEDIQHCYIV